MESAEPIRYAGFWRRFTAYGLDQTLVQVLAFVASYLIGAAANAQSADEGVNQLIRMGWLPAPAPGQSINDVLMQSGASGTPWFSGMDLAVFLACSFFYHVWFTAGAWQATPGKRWCGIYVIRTDGARISLPFSMIRWFARFMSWFTFCLGFIMVAFSREKVSMHDAICGTRVIYGKR